MKRITQISIYCILILFSIAPAFAQSCFTNTITNFGSTTNFLNVNTNNFIITNAGSNIENYHYSTFKLSTEISKVINMQAPYQGAGNQVFNQSAPFTILNKFRAYRIEFTPQITIGSTPFYLRAVVIQPLVPAANSPCIFVTSGTGGLLESFATHMAYNISDLLIRGYTVVYYENVYSGRVIAYLNNDPNSPLAVGSFFDVLAGWFATAETKINRLQYMSMLIDDAIAKTIKVYSTTLSVNPNSFFALGHSIGTMSTYLMVLGKKSDFPTNTLNGLFISPNNNFTIAGNESATYSVRAGIIYSGPMVPETNTNVINVIDATDANKRLLYIHGVSDVTVDITNGMLGTILSEGPLKIRTRLNSFNIKNYLVAICGAGHNISSISQNFINIDSKTTPQNPTNEQALYDAIKNASNLTTLKTTITSSPTLNSSFEEFKTWNIPCFQIGNTNALFMQNTLTGASGTSYVMCPSNTDNGDNIQYIKNNGTASSWLYSLVPWNQNCSGGTTGRQANPNPTPTETKATNLPLMFPNPTTGKLNINLKLENDVNGYNVNIFSVDGRSILNNTNSEKMEAGNIISKEFDISAQPNGVYFIRVTSENNILLNKTFILNK